MAGHSRIPPLGILTCWPRHAMSWFMSRLTFRCNLAFMDHLHVHDHDHDHVHVMPRHATPCPAMPCPVPSRPVQPCTPSYQAAEDCVGVGYKPTTLQPSCDLSTHRLAGLAWSCFANASPSPALRGWLLCGVHKRRLFPRSLLSPVASICVTEDIRRHLVSLCSSFLLLIPCPTLSLRYYNLTASSLAH